MIRAKVITICGSLRNQEYLMKETERLTLEGYNVISVIYETRDRNSYSEEEINQFIKMHYQKIDLADAVYIVNVGGIVGTHTKKDIEYAESLGKEILYMEKM